MKVRPLPFDNMPETTTQTFDRRSGVLLIEAVISSTINIKARLIFDTGATYCMLPWRLVRALDLKIDPDKTVQTTTASSVETSPIVTIPKLTVSNQSIENATCLVRDLPPLSGVDGLLGLSFLKFFNIKINFEEGFIELERYEQ